MRTQLCEVHSQNLQASFRLIQDESGTDCEVEWDPGVTPTTQQQAGAALGQQNMLLLYDLDMGPNRLDLRVVTVALLKYILQVKAAENWPEPTDPIVALVLASALARMP